MDNKNQSNQSKLNYIEPLVFELSTHQRRGFIPVKSSVESYQLPVKYFRKKPAQLPEMSELEVVRHFTRLSVLNHHLERGFYPLGSCTMKYNPKINEEISSYQGFTDHHPLMPPEHSQGCLAVISELSDYLCKILGMDYVTLHPVAGAHGEYTGLAIIRKYFQVKGESEIRSRILVPDSSHGTNPASASLAGFKTVQVASDSRGMVDLKALKSELDKGGVAAVMLTNPNTLGIFEEDILQISRLSHEAGALLYYDGANLNAILGKTTPGDMGFDVVHTNLHKTFSTPHGGGGPGSGPVGVKSHLYDYLPFPLVEKNENGQYCLNYSLRNSIGKVSSFYGNFLVYLRALVYIKRLGSVGLERVAEYSVLNANYLKSRLSEAYEISTGIDKVCMHEFVISCQKQKERGVSAMDIAKFLIDHGIHSPTVYFPLIIKEAMMIEPTETEAIEEMDKFCDLMLEADRLSREQPDVLTSSPRFTPVGRLDDVAAARNPNINYFSNQE